jgi:hypothetical protein
MKWYNYKDKWIDISRVGFITNKYDLEIELWFSLLPEDWIQFVYKSKEERDAEFAKIKILMGIEDFTSRCC